MDVVEQINAILSRATQDFDGRDDIMRRAADRIAALEAQLAALAPKDAEPVAVNSRDGCEESMTPERVAYFLRRFKNEEKLLGPHEQWALDVAIAAFESHPAPEPAGLEKAEAEAYEIGKRDGYSEAVQQIDLLTGGDGEYRYCTDHDPERHTPDPATMIRRIVDRVATLQARVSELEAATGEAKEIIGHFLRCEYDGNGLTDCVDNTGAHYKSDDLASRIKTAEALMPRLSALSRLSALEKK